MYSKVIRCIWLLFPILRLRKTRNDFYTKTRLCFEEHRRTSQTGGKQASVLYICVLFKIRLPSAPLWADRYGWELWRDSGPVAYLPVRGQGDQSHGRPFFTFFYFQFCTLLQQLFENRFSIRTDMQLPSLECYV